MSGHQLVCKSVITDFYVWCWGKVKSWNTVSASAQRIPGKSYCLLIHDLDLYISCEHPQLALNLTFQLPTPPLITDNHSAPPDVTGLLERSSHHAERPHVASVRGVSRGFNHHTSVMETADGEFPAHSHSHTHIHAKSTPVFLLPCCLSLCLLLSQSANVTGKSYWLTCSCCHGNGAPLHPPTPPLKNPSRSCRNVWFC